MKIKKRKLLRFIWIALVAVATLSLVAASVAPILYGW